MLTFISIYFGLGLICGIYAISILNESHGYTFRDKFSIFLSILFFWPTFVLSYIIDLKENKENNE